MAAEYSFGFEESVFNELKKGPQDVDSVMKLLYLAGMNPALRLYNLPKKLVAAAQQRVKNEMHNFKAKWSQAISSYSSPEEFHQAMFLEHQYLQTIWNVLEVYNQRSQQCNCPVCDVARNPQKYSQPSFPLSRFSMN